MSQSTPLGGLELTLRDSPTPISYSVYKLRDSLFRTRLPFAAISRLAPAPPSFAQSHRDWMNGDNPAKLIAQRQWLTTREGLGEGVPHCGATLFGGLWILVCDERRSHDPAISIEAEPNGNLSGRSFLGSDPARLQRGANIVRIGNRNLPRRRMTGGTYGSVRDRECHQDQETGI
jgi:hypothetical protein